MKNIFKLLILLFAVSSPALVSAAQWQSFGKSAGSEFFFDRDSISGPATERLLVVKRNYLEGKLAPTSIELKYKINCIAEESIITSGTVYQEPDLQGEIRPTAFPGLNISKKQEPNTMGSLYIKTACASQNSPTQVAPKSEQNSQNNRQLTSNNSSFICRKEEFLSRLDGVIDVYPPGSTPTWRSGTVGIEAEDIGVIVKNSDRVETTEYSRNQTKTAMVYDKVGLVNLTLPLGKSYPNYLKFSYTKAHETYSIYIPADFSSASQFPFITRLDSKQTMEYNDYRIGKCRPGTLAAPIPPKAPTREQAAAAEQASKVRQAQDRQIFGLVDDFNTRLIDQSSAARRLSSCIGVMKGAQYAANSISQQNLSIVLAQQESAFYSFGSSRFPPVDTLERMMLDGAMRDAQSGAEGLSRNNQQALVFKIANNCKATLGSALKN
ncbi:hypothetical protein G6712_06090 [Polynucleobacter paneuropaeus]|nr:hypothetical protein [Polynucleobacter paneuropaeus]